MDAFHRVAVALGFAASLAVVTAASAQDAQAPSAQPSAPQVGQPQEASEAAALATPGAVAQAPGSNCPKLVIAPAAGVMPGKEHTAKLEGLARDCANLGAETILKVAVVGEAAGANSFDAPLSLSIQDAEGKPVETRKINVKVEMPEGVQKVSFNHVEENVSLPPVDGGYANWTVIVGFDSSAIDEPDVAEVAPAKPERKVSSKASRRAAARKAARVARAAQPATPPIPPVANIGTAGGAPVPKITTNSGSTVFDALAADQRERKIKAQNAEIDRRRREAQAARAAGRPQAAIQPLVPQAQVAAR